VQLAARRTHGEAVVIPFVRWQRYNGGRKFARNAPHARVHDVETGVEFAPWSEVEFTLVYTYAIERTRTSAWPFLPSTGASRLGLQVQWNY
jgi:outer membrane receptor for ferrienterochelin and colicin